MGAPQPTAKSSTRRIRRLSNLSIHLRFALLVCAAWGFSSVGDDRLFAQEDESAKAEPQRLAVVGGHLHVGDGREIADAAILIEDGKIVEVGERGQVAVPDGVDQIDATGKHIAPGMVNLRSQLFIDPSNTLDRGGNAGRMVAEGLNPLDPRWERVRSEGITTVGVQFPSSQNISGLGAVLRLGPGQPVAGADESFSFLLERDTYLSLALGVSGSQSTSAARLQQYYNLRSMFVGARQYEKSWDAYWESVDKYNKALADYQEKKAASEKKPEPKKADSKKPDTKKADPKKPEPKKAAPKKPAAPVKVPPLPKPPKKPRESVSSEALVRALHGDLRVFVEAHRVDDIGYAKRLRDEFNLDLVLVGGTSARHLAAELAESKIPVVCEPILMSSTALEYRDHSEENARQLASAGVRVAISSARGEAPQAARMLRLHACAAVRGGLDAEVALKGLTLEPAELLGVADRVGSIAKGKHADLVLFDGHPLDARSRVLRVLVDGETVAEPETPAYRRGGRVADLPKAEEIEVAADATVLVGATILSPRGDQVLEQLGTIVLQDGKIRRVLAGRPKVTGGAKIVDLEGSWILPGFIDAHSHVGVQGAVDDIASALSRDLIVADAFDPWSSEVSDALATGTTSAALAPGFANVVGGEVHLVKLIPGQIPVAAEPRAVAWKASLVPNINLPRYPTAASGAFELFRQFLADKSNADAAATLMVRIEWPGQIEAAVEALAEHGKTGVIVEGTRPLRADKLSQLPSLFANAKTKPRAFVLTPRTGSETASALASAAELDARGVPLAFASTGTKRDLLSSAVLSMKHGLNENAALRALTSNPAKLFGVSDRVGSIRDGADADFVVWSADPFGLNASIQSVWVRGRKLVGDVKKGAERKSPAAPPSVAKNAASRSAETVSADPAETLLIRAKHVYTMSHGVIENGQVAVRDGKIIAVGKEIDIKPEQKGVRTIDVAGSVMPGLIDCGSTVGIRGRASEEFREVTPTVRVIEGVDFEDAYVDRARNAGVTTLAITPGGRNVVGGLGAIIKTRGRGREDLVDGAAFLVGSLTPEASSGNRTLRSGRPDSYVYRIPTTRMGTIFVLRRALIEAAQIPAQGLDLLNQPADFKLTLSEAERASLADLLEGKQQARLLADTRAEILTAMRIAKEFGITVQVQGGREALNIVDRLAATKTPVILDAALSLGPNDKDNQHVSQDLPARLAAAGVPFAFASGQSTQLELLLSRIRMLPRYGLSEEVALRSVTIDAAKILGIEKRVGSIAVGMDADLLAIGGSPLDIAASTLWVMLEGDVLETK